MKRKNFRGLLGFCRHHFFNFPHILDAVTSRYVTVTILTKWFQARSLNYCEKAYFMYTIIVLNIYYFGHEIKIPKY